MDEHNSFQLKGIDPPDALEEDLSAKTIRCTDFKVSSLYKVISFSTIPSLLDLIPRTLQRRSLFLSTCWSISVSSRLSMTPTASFFLLQRTSAVFASSSAQLSDLLSFHTLSSMTGTSARSLSQTSWSTRSSKMQ